MVEFNLEIFCFVTDKWQSQVPTQKFLATEKAINLPTPQQPETRTLSTMPDLPYHPPGTKPTTPGSSPAAQTHCSINDKKSSSPQWQPLIIHDPDAKASDIADTSPTPWAPTNNKRPFASILVDSDDSDDDLITRSINPRSSDAPPDTPFDPESYNTTLNAHLHTLTIPQLKGLLKDYGVLFAKNHSQETLIYLLTTHMNDPKRSSIPLNDMNDPTGDRRLKRKRKRQKLALGCTTGALDHQHSEADEAEAEAKQSGGRG
ncbi:hypothetical protein BJ875DRAFT_442499 [Amylocarpus encephaloides]|uniref:Uncharacterized protein n=1 Tax=Amylocarpus encephaloides TaxID=45428 RepID=A0A9P8C5M4_9HELO|nr:hypothetical protein BJ875DRAFT_442499 [Amylocarpus encephaloides]